MSKIITLGEIMLRFSTNVGERINMVDSLCTHYGGAEANVAISLANFGHEVSFASKVPENALGTGAVQHLRRYNVSTKHVLTGGQRLGTYYVESGSGKRPSSVIYDRVSSSFAGIQVNEWKSQAIFHISGITPALSDNWKKLTLDLIEEAQNNNCLISFDVNYRNRLWSQKQAKEFLKLILPKVDYCSAGKLDAMYLLDIPEYKNDQEELIYYYQKIQKKYPNIKCLYSTNREVVTASENYLTGSLLIDSELFQSSTYHIQPIIDRIGAGDAFVAGVLHSLLNGDSYQQTIDFATVAAVLKHTINGDANQFTCKEILQFMKNDSGKIMR
ncbi:MAG: sugar kinase [Enterococcus lacertideformus]|uniref:Sugar kinase n=1 Tax=Enterococcus lacertideformus TaxID=2771493 RepID=A0A931FC21_9ENTE|nr:sugar kinase [Enterococcus lacertideformus]